MTNTKSTKRALISSVLALFLCFTMLIGTTFAWFTDSVTSANNVITSGNLKIELEYLDEAGNWQTVDKADKIFDPNALWEPGYTEVVYLRMRNAGSLALKYQLGVNIVSEDKGTNIDGKEFKLSDYIYFDVFEGIDGSDTTEAFDDREAAMKDTTEKTLISEGYSKAGYMLAETGTPTYEYLAMVVYMPTTVGNEANHNGTDDASIELGVNVMATQFTAEEDSFDKFYDEDAVFGTYVELEAGADLLAALAGAEKDLPVTVVLNGNVEWPTEGHHGENDITPASDITIIGNGNTITATGAGVTPLGDDKAPMVLKNVKIVDNSVSYNEGAWEFTYLEMGGSSLTCENVTFADEIQLGTNATFTNCSFESNEESVYAVWVEDGSATFTNCTFTGYRGLKMHEDYGSEISSVVVKGCTFSNLEKKPGIAIGNIYMNGDTYTSGSTTHTNTTDTTVSITGNTFINCQPGDQGNYKYESDTDVNTFNFVDENNTVLNNATVVSTKDDLLELSAKTLTSNNNIAEEAVIVIGSDIDMQGAEFSAIIAQRGDKLTVLGNGHKISNIKIVSGVNDNTTGQASMFYAYPNSTLAISDLTLENITVTAEANDTGYAAAVIGYCEGAAILSNVDVVNATVTGVKSSGMLVGHLSGSLNATDCDLDGTVTLANYAAEPEGHYAGKYVGTAGNTTIRGCTADVTVSGSLKPANDGEIYGRKVSGELEGMYKYDNAVMGGLYELLPTLKAGDVLILPEQTYETSGTFTIPHGVTIKGAEGATVVIKQISSAQDNIFNCEGDAVIENITFESNRKGYAINGSAKNHDTDGDITVINCNFKGIATEKNWGVYKNLNGDLTLIGCTFDNYNNAICGVNNGGDSTTVITGCTFTNINGEAIGYVNSSMPANFESEVIANNTGLTADNVIGY